MKRSTASLILLLPFRKQIRYGLITICLLALASMSASCQDIRETEMKPVNKPKPGVEQTPAVNDHSLPPMPNASRQAPPKVPPLVIEGIRYEQVLNAEQLGLSSRTGVLAAYQDSTGEFLWHLQVYHIPRGPNLEQDVQDVFFTRMERLSEGLKLLIENERADQFEVDLEVRRVKQRWLGPSESQ
jgi:hypothetical protein